MLVALFFISFYFDINYFIRYIIVGGSAARNFSIDTIRGSIKPIGIIDFESIPDNLGDSAHFSAR